MIAVPKLVSLEEAKRHLRGGESPDVGQTEQEIQIKLDQATAFVLRLCGALADDAWDVSTVPAPVVTAILMHLAELFADRGDEERDVPFGSHVARYLMAAGYRDPVLA